MVDNVKSQSITNADSSPVVANTRGLGGAGDKVDFSDLAAATAAGLGSTSSTYKILRVPSNCKLKAMKAITTERLDSNASPTLAVDIGAYYSDTSDGTQAPLQGTLISANCFLAAAAFGGSAGGTNIDALASFATTNRMKELWSALGLSSDPGGNIDIVVAVHTAAATGGAGNIMLDADVVL